MTTIDNQNKRLKELADLHDPSEFIAACRRMIAEENQVSEDVLFPPAEDALDDIMSNFLGIWLTMTVNLPLENKEQVIVSIDNMTETLKQMRETLSKDNFEFSQRDLLHFVKKAIAPRLWEI